MSDNKYYQCHLRKGNVETDGFIESRGAYVGKSVEMPPGSGEFWEVTRVGVVITQDALKETQRQRRQKLPSIRDTKKDKKQQEAVR